MLKSSDVPGLLKNWEYLNLFKTNLWFYSFVLFVDQLKTFRSFDGTEIRSK